MNKSKSILLFLVATLGGVTAQALEQNYQGFVLSHKEGATGKIRVVEISPVASGGYLAHVQGDQHSFDFRMAGYADASALANDLLIGAEVRCSDTLTGASGSTTCLVYTVSL
jgi:hypothetical protein